MKSQLVCPRCGRRVLDTDSTVINDVRVIRQLEKWKADYYIKCWKCSSHLGIRLAGHKD